MKAVLDTNLLVSAFVFPGGAPEVVYRRALEGHLEIVTSAPLLAELARVLAEKFGWEQPRVDEAVTQLITIATVVTPSETLAVIADDPDDDRVLEAAVAGDAALVVSGDSHLLRLAEWRGIRVLNPAAFVSEFE